MTDKIETELYTLYCGDCLDIMPTLAAGSVDAVVTDPPYLGLAGGTEINGNGVTNRVEISLAIGDRLQANLNWVKPAWNLCKYGAMVFTSHHAIDLVKQAFPDNTTVGLVVWYKRNSPLPQNNVPHFNTEFIWLFKKSPGLKWKEIETFYDIPIIPAGCFASERILQQGSGRAAHPTQKPELLMRKLIKATDQSALVIDPFMGSGTTGVACMQTGRRFIGIEIDPVYFEIAAKRIATAAAQLRLNI